MVVNVFLFVCLFIVFFFITIVVNIIITINNTSTIKRVCFVVTDTVCHAAIVNHTSRGAPVPAR